MLLVKMQALELMKTHVVKTTPDAPLSEAVDLMDLYQVNGLPVVDAEGRLLGLLTERDVLRALLSNGTESSADDAPIQHIEQNNEQSNAWRTRVREAANKSVREYMTQPAISIPEHSEALQAALLLLNHPLKRLPVTDDLGRVVGVLNRIDVIQALFEDQI